MVYFRETGPYGEGHVIVQSRIDCTPCPVNYHCHDRRCAEYITPSSVVRAMDLAENVDPSRPNQVDDDESLETVNIFVSRFGPDGMVEYVPLVRRPLTTQDALALAYRMTWLEFLDGRVVDENARIRDLLGFYLPPEPDTVQPFLNEAKAGFDRFASVAADAAEMTGNLLVELGSPNRNAATLQQTVQELNRLDESLRVLGKSEEYLQPLSSIFFFEKENLEGDDPVLLAQHTLQMYRDAEQRARLMAGKLDKMKP